MEKYYEKIHIKENITNIKLDIGLSYNAPYSQCWLEKEPNLFVFGFEPNTDSVLNILSGNIVKRVPGHGTPIQNEYINERFCIFPVALSNVDSPCEMTFYKTEKDVGCSSLYKPIDPSLGSFKHQSAVPVYSLKHFFDLFPFDRFEYIDYIKIDAQGADFDIIKSAGDYLKERVVYITAEPESNQYSGCAHNTCHNMEEYLLTQNFVRINHPNTQDPTFLNKKFLHLKYNIYIYQQ